MCETVSQTNSWQTQAVDVGWDVDWQESMLKTSYLSMKVLSFAKNDNVRFFKPLL